MIGFIRYRNAVNLDHGPIEKIFSWKSSNPMLGNYYEAIAVLKSDLCAQSATDVYLHNAGGGAAIHRAIAVHKAISEALERWAFFSCIADEQLRSRYGLDVDPTTNGFACHPSFIEKIVRRKAFYEAVERWALFNWWHSKLPARVIGLSDVSGQFEILTPFKELRVVVVFRKTSFDRFVYGFSASKNKNEALIQAFVEQARNEKALEKLDQQFQPRHVTDKRLLHFASEVGFESFFERYLSSLNQSIPAAKPKTLVDKKIAGPWAKYANVWRVLFDGGETFRDQSDDKIFLF